MISGHIIRGLVLSSGEVVVLPNHSRNNTRMVKGDREPCPTGKDRQIDSQDQLTVVLCMADMWKTGFILGGSQVRDVRPGLSLT